MDFQLSINDYYKVLDNGYVGLIGHMGSDDSIVQAARVSYGKGTKTPSDDKTLIRYLMRNKHTTPIEMVMFKFHISMPLHCHRQFIRHRMSTTNEYSARYSEVPDVIYDDYKLNVQSKNNKQGRSDEVINEEKEGELKGKILKNQKDAFSLYKEALGDGVAREIARMHLPLNSYTYFYWKIDLHNLFHFLKLRCDSHAQFEIRQYANILAGIVKRICPVAFEAWYDYSFLSSNFTKYDKILLNKGIYNNYSKEETIEYAKSIGLSSREIDEFWDKIKIPDEKSFDLPEPLPKDFLGAK